MLVVRFTIWRRGALETRLTMAAALQGFIWFPDPRDFSKVLPSTSGFTINIQILPVLMVKSGET
jgi:hypothetical protein